MNFAQKLIILGLEWMIKDIRWRMDSSKLSKRLIKSYLEDNIYLAHVLMNEGELQRFKGTRDQIAHACYKWILINIKYKTDQDNFGKKEKWEDIDVILDRGVADCESMSTLWLAWVRAHGISKAQIRLCTGNVGGGHAWGEYMFDSTGNWGIFDMAYRVRLPADDPKYKDKWFCVNDLMI